MLRCALFSPKMTEKSKLQPYFMCFKSHRKSNGFHWHLIHYGQNIWNLNSSQARQGEEADKGRGSVPVGRILQDAQGQRGRDGQVQRQRQRVGDRLGFRAMWVRDTSEFYTVSVVAYSGSWILLLPLQTSHNIISNIKNKIECTVHWIVKLN